MVTTKHKPIVDTQKIKRKESKCSPIEIKSQREKKNKGITKQPENN